MKNVYVLEKYMPLAYYEELLADLDSRFDSFIPDLRVKFSSMYDEMREAVKAKLVRSKQNGGGIWEGVIGRYTPEDLIEEGYSEYSRDSEAIYRVVVANVVDDATTWVGYSRGVRLCLLTESCLNSWDSRRTQEV